MKMRARWPKKFLFLPLALLALGATATEGWQLAERFKEVSAGEWVRLNYSGGSEHLLLAAAKDDNTVTLEERIREEGYLTSWTQIVMDLKKRMPVLLRERMPDGQIIETPIQGEKSGLHEDFYALFAAHFFEEPQSERVVVPAGTFSCKVYRAVFNKKLIRIFLSDQIPLYPVKVLIPNYQLTISLAAFGKGMESRFPSKKTEAPEKDTGQTTPEKVSPGAPGRSDAECEVCPR